MSQERAPRTVEVQIKEMNGKYATMGFFTEDGAKHRPGESFRVLESVFLENRGRLEKA